MKEYVKECDVLSYNEHLKILVFQFNDMKIQITAELDATQKTVYVKCKNNKYEIVNKDEYEKFVQSLSQKKGRKLFNATENIIVDGESVESSVDH